MSQIVNVNTSELDLSDIFQKESSNENINKNSINISKLIQSKQKRQEQNVKYLVKKKDTKKLSKKDTKDKDKDKDKQEEKNNLITKIEKYQSNVTLGPIIKEEMKLNYDRSQLEKKSIKKLEDILKKIRDHLSNRGLNNFVDTTAEYGCKIYEKLLTRYGIDISGFSDTILNDDNFWYELEALKCEISFPSMPPHMKIMYTILQTTYIQYQINKFSKMIGNNNPNVDPIKIKEEVKTFLEDTKNENKNEKTKNEKKDETKSTKTETVLPTIGNVL